MLRYCRAAVTVIDESELHPATDEAAAAALCHPGKYCISSPQSYLQELKLTTTKKASTLVHHLNQPPGTVFPQVFQLVIFIYCCTAAVIIREADNGDDISAPPAADVGSIVVECRSCGTQQRAWEIAPPSITSKLPPCFFDFARTEPTPAAQVEAYRSSGSRQQSRHEDEQPEYHKKRR